MRIKRWLWAIAITVVVLLVAKHWLLDTAAAASGQYSIDPDALHRAASADGRLPERIEVENIGDFAFPQTLVVAGEGFHMHPMALLVYRVVWPDHSLIIDTALGPAAANKMPGSKFDGAAYARMQAAMKQASAIVLTHEHSDHIGGIASAPDFGSIAPRVRVTREQLDSPQLERGDFGKNSLGLLQPIDYQGLYTLAPGVVLQKAPGHTRGTQLVYVELADGKRFLFVGDIAWTHENIARKIGRPRLPGLLMKEDRPAVAAQLTALSGLPSDIHLIVSHDPVALERDLKAGLYHKGFSQP